MVIIFFTKGGFSLDFQSWGESHFIFYCFQPYNISNTLLTTIYSLFYPAADCPKNSAVCEQQQPGAVRGAAGAVAGTTARVSGLAAPKQGLLAWLPASVEISHLLPPLFLLLHFVFKPRQCPRSVSDSPLSPAWEGKWSICPHVRCVLLWYKILLICSDVSTASGLNGGGFRLLSLVASGPLVHLGHLQQFMAII